MAWRYVFEINSVFKPTGNTEVLSLTQTITDEPVAKLVEPDEDREEKPEEVAAPEIIETQSVEEKKNKNEAIEVLGETQKLQPINADNKV